ncbi:LruC domain-containing protein [Bacteroides intestinalis]|uniref:LruC domain-containing protein n=1 Tax=Bacteroides intestinalis TaxID=329854 RepID=UPI000E1DE52F|nr:LruC domain-containing protein [Bacteroides intestinalis]QDO71443.1 LruC domain-containing protein [Bacteroides intestinalis]UCB35627.1 LruC domain-containing protein [Bacteroides intestinalis]UCB39869.1 LruC domain-containing protein [Bacteroides intestinalis]
MTKKANFYAIHGAFYYLLCSVLVILMVSGCTRDVYDPNGGGEDKPNSFDFSTTSTIQLNVKYDVPEGYKVLFNVYFEDPFTTDEGGQTVLRTDITPAITRMTDENGEYHAKEIVAADHGSDVYIYTSYVGVPGLVQTTITDNVINADIEWKLTDGIPQTRADKWDPSTEYGLLGTWQTNGRPNYLDSEGELVLSASVLKTIRNTIQEGGICPQTYRQSADFKVDDLQGRDTEVSVRFIGGNSSAASIFGYYCYKDGASVKEIKAAKKYIVFPNTHTAGYYGKPIGLKGGECVKLHYIDENGVDKGTVFPNGVRIGWFLLNNAFVKEGKTDKICYSTTALNGDGRTHTAAFRINDFVVLSFEDYTDYDYNDVQFNVWSNPIEAIAPDVPSVTPDPGTDDDRSVAYRMTYKGILAFEDNWPNKGDYDLNDVIVKYNSVLAFNTSNQVLSTEDTFTALWSGASLKNGFAYQMNTDRSNVVTEFENISDTSQGLDRELAKATVNVFTNALVATENNTKTASYKIKNTLTTPVDHETFGVAPYNPFIMVHENLGNNRCEVHLVNYKPTEKADMSLFHTGKDLSSPNSGVYYVAAENYPFAIQLVDAEDFSTTETESVDITYSDFIKWVKSNGSEYKDWYKK